MFSCVVRRKPINDQAVPTLVPILADHLPRVIWTSGIKFRYQNCLPVAPAEQQAARKYEHWIQLSILFWS